MKPALCPVCNGSGVVGDLIEGYQAPTKHVCHGCNGKGWVSVPEEEVGLKSSELKKEVKDGTNYR